MALQENATSMEMNLTPDEICRMRVALVAYMEKALNGEVDGQIFPAAVDLFTYLLEESRNRIS